MHETNEKLRALQQRELETLKEVIRICDENNIRYYAIFGTQLGAVRHQGFIPWDDDVDICMSRSDYNRFLEIAPGKLSEGYRLETYANCKNDEVYTARVIDVNTRVRVHAGKEPVEQSLWVDIWSFCAVPDNKFVFFCYRMAMLFQRMLVQMSVYKTIIHQGRKNRPFHEKAIMWVCEHIDFSKCINTKKAKARFEKLADKMDARGGAWLANIWSETKFKHLYAKAWFGDGVMMPFEDIQVCMPEKNHEILSECYGDYMKLPPEEDRDIQHKMEIVEL